MNDVVEKESSNNIISSSLELSAVTAENPIVATNIVVATNI